jgi:hypothetical protein
MQEIEIALPIVRFIGFVDVGGGMCKEGTTSCVPEKTNLVGFVELFLGAWFFEVCE